MVRVIVNCDDFGLDVPTNLAIAKGFEDGVISSTTLLANMPGFRHAQNLIESGKVPSDAVGMHFNLTAGEPITDGMRNLGKFCESGLFHGRIRERPLFNLTDSEANAVRKEFEAQLLRILSVGLKPSHIDGHHHIHTEWAIYKEIRGVLNDLGPKRMRISRSHGVALHGLRGTLKSMYKKVFNFRLRFDGFATTRAMGEFPDFVHVHQNWQTLEIMVHFVPISGQMILDGIADPKYLRQVEEFLDSVEVINYSDL
jgi:predicted glycoside hydrolase/deacetylase ChbG (UPF0249 family)